MRILLIGSGGREHAMAWKLAQSKDVEQIYCYPGNGGSSSVSKARVLEEKFEKWSSATTWTKENGIDLTVVGPEQPLAEGIVDEFMTKDQLIFGPSIAAAQLEASKLFAKEVMIDAGIPTATFFDIPNLKIAKEKLSSCDYPLVLKADGLAAGKGVAIVNNPEDALAFCVDVLEKKVFGEEQSVFAEEFLEGEEASFFVITDGTSYQSMVSSQDHKRLLDGELGPNTGGMGAYSPAPVLTKAIEEQAIQQVVEPTLAELRKRGMPFTGILYVGLMITRNGPKVLEYNVRFGDPEAQVLLRRMDSDFAQLLYKSSKALLDQESLQWSKDHAFGLVLASQGYPQSPAKGASIEGLDQVQEPAVVFHAGTKQENDSVRVSGGRVLTLTTTAPSLIEARDMAYREAEKIKFEGKIFRKDIGWRAL